MKFASLGSGSEGNGWLVQPSSPQGKGGGDALLIDCGFTLKDTVARLSRFDIDPELLSGIVCTHEHDDHLGGVFKFSRKFGTPVYLTHGTWRAAVGSKKVKPDYLETGLVTLIDSECRFNLAAFEVETFPVPHDAKEPIQLLVRDDKHTLGILTDCGSSTPLLVEKLRQADVVILESNHCPDLLTRSEYPPSLKRRVSGDYGHLSNQVACEILESIATGKLRYAVAAHLSRNTNEPQLVHDMWEKSLAPHQIDFKLACQEAGLEWHCVSTLCEGTTVQC